MALRDEPKKNVLFHTTFDKVSFFVLALNVTLDSP